MNPWTWLSYVLPFTRAVKVEHQETKGIRDHTYIGVPRQPPWVSDRLPQPALGSCDRTAQKEGVSTESRVLMVLLQKGA